MTQPAETFVVDDEVEAAWQWLERAAECLVLAEIDPAELELAEQALEQAEALGERAGLLRGRP